MTFRQLQFIGINSLLLSGNI